MNRKRVMFRGKVDLLKVGTLTLIPVVFQCTNTQQMNSLVAYTFSTRELISLKFYKYCCNEYDK